MRVIGDIHAGRKTHLQRYNDIKNSSEKSFQVGDFGFGFYDETYSEFLPIKEILRPTDYYILGNHDDPVLGRSLPNHIESGNEIDGIFVVNGARSSDRMNRIEGRDWWEREEHTREELYNICDKWEESSAEIVISHDCPSDIYRYMEGHHSRETNFSITSSLLSAMFYMRKPKLWIFGHHHQSFSEVIEGTRFICLDELEYIDI